MLLPWVLVLFAAKPAWTAPTPEALDSILRASSQSLPEERLEAATRPLVGAPYVLSPLGEGSGTDPDPRLRLDAFDCTTFVETSIALAAAENMGEVGGLLDGIRYRGAPSFSNRRHLVESWWVPDLVQARVLEDVTEQIGGDRTVKETFALSMKRWKGRRIARDLKLDSVPIGEYPFAWIPLDALDSLDIPPGTIVNVVRMDVPWSPTRITHQGLILRDPISGKMIVRHASPVSKRVVDEPLAKMIKRYLHPRVEKKWRLVGVSFLKLRG